MFLTWIRCCWHRWNIVRVTTLRTVVPRVWVSKIRGILISPGTYRIVSYLWLITLIHSLGLVNWCRICVIHFHFLVTISVLLIRLLSRWVFTVLVVISNLPLWAFTFEILICFNSKIKIALLTVKATFLVYFSDFL